MCGIGGWYSSHAELSEGRRQQVLAQLGHRGPDGNGMHHEGPVLMAHTRLAIIDPDSGQQPMHSADGNLTLTFNGEIYNYLELRTELERQGCRFTTHSDSETLLQAYAAYGTACLERLHGMFAFALYDRRKRRMLLARDRLGIKPLYLMRIGNGWGFASEIKALLALSDSRPSIDADALAVFIQGHCGLGADTLLHGVESLQPGQAALIEAADGQPSLHRWQYWSLTDQPSHQWRQDTASDYFDDLIENVMRVHLRTDVPYGLFLSGGLDSAILLALISRISSEPVRTFSLAFTEDAGVHELELAPQLARRFNARHTTFTVTAAQMLERVADTVWASDHPNSDLANLPTSLLAEAASDEIKVVLTGEGGDETFAGYDRYGKSAWHYWKKNLRCPGTGGYRTRGRLTPAMLRRLFQPGLLDRANGWRQRLIRIWRQCPEHWSHMQRMQYLDLHGELQDSLLVKVDRMLMSQGLEGRVPFLDHRVVAFGLGLPDAIKRHQRQGKYLLRHWATPALGRDVTFARKRGFKVPIGKALFDKNFLKRLRPALENSQAIKACFRPATVREIIDNPRASRHREQTVWALTVFALWHRLLLEGDGRRPGAGVDPVEVLTG